MKYQTSLLALGFFALQTTSFGQAPSISLHLVPSGTFKKVGGYIPYGMKMSATAPDGVKAPTRAGTNLMYASLHLGAGEGKNYAIAVEEPIGPTSKIYVDATGTGDLSSVTPSTWTAHPHKAPDGTEKVFYDATLTVDFSYDGKVVPCTVGVYPGPDGFLDYYSDFSLMGKVTLAGVSYDAIYWDTPAVFDPSKSKGTLMVDTDHDGKFHPGYEFFPSDKPFNIKGTTYELTTHRGLLALVKSKVSVKERTLADIPSDPNLANGLREGKIAYSFDGKTMSGTDVSFPTSYAGKIVMLDFWATWCGPCMREAPNVAKIYSKYHDQGFDILGVTLDNPKSEDAIVKTTKNVGMTWPQIYEGRAWESSLVKKYGIKSIPATYLVDGDTGKIIAMLNQLRGESLEKTITKALAAKKAAKGSR